jgi:hypothetical protein
MTQPSLGTRLRERALEQFAASRGTKLSVHVASYRVELNGNALVRDDIHLQQYHFYYVA